MHAWKGPRKGQLRLELGTEQGSAGDGQDTQGHLRSCSLRLPLCLLGNASLGEEGGSGVIGFAFWKDHPDVTAG